MDRLTFVLAMFLFFHTEARITSDRWLTAYDLTSLEIYSRVVEDLSRRGQLAEEPGEVRPGVLGIKDPGSGAEVPQSKISTVAPPRAASGVRLGMTQFCKLFPNSPNCGLS